MKTEVLVFKKHPFGDEIALDIKIDGIRYKGCLTEVDESG